MVRKVTKPERTKYINFHLRAVRQILIIAEKFTCKKMMESGFTASQKKKKN
jgi:hypothetical protein